MKKSSKAPKFRFTFRLAAGVTIAIFMIGMVAVSLAAGAPRAAKAALDANAITASQQTRLVTQSKIAPVEWLAGRDDREAGFLPVRAVSSSRFVALVSAEDVALSVASVNPDTNTVAVVRTTATTKVIYVAVLLEAQLAEVLPVFRELAVDVEIVRSKTAVLPVGHSGLASGAYPAEPGGESGLLRGTALAEAPGSSSPYVQAVNARAASVGDAARAEATGKGSSMMWNFLLYGLLLGLAIRIFLSMRKARKGTGRGSAPLGAGGQGGGDVVPDTRFADVAGCDEAVEEMTELVAFLKEPERFTRVGAKAPRGALLVGPPGTGKTLLARALAGEAGVPFYAVAGSDFVEMFVGVGAKRVRELFDRAREHEEGAIIFIDEIDAIGRSRTAGSSSNANAEAENTLNALLVELDGFTESKVIVIGATNRGDMLDAALIRPGRLDRKIQVPLPDRAGRERILGVHGAGKPLSPNVDLNLIARRTPGMSGAELAQLVNEACMSAGRVDRMFVTEGDFDSAIATVTMGKARNSAVISVEDRLLTAWHEAGHAGCGLIQPDGVSPVSISIVPRGQAGGVTHFPARDSGYLTRRQAYAQLVTAMGGMAAEQLHLGEGEFTTGPSSDLQQGTNLALAMVTQYGMGERLLVKSDAILGASASATDEAVEEADALLRRALADAKLLLTENWALLTGLVDALLEWETLTNPQIEALVQGRVLVHQVPAPAAPRQDAGVVVLGPPAERVRFMEPRARLRELRLGPITVSRSRRRIRP